MKYTVLLFSVILMLYGGGCGRRPDIDPTPSPVLPTEAPVSPSPEPTVEVILPGTENLANLEAVQIPFADPEDLARRLQGLTQDIPATVEPPETLPQVGDAVGFQVSNLDDDEQFEVSATLRHLTDHAYYWIGDDVSYDPDDLEQLADVFENQIYPQNRAFFGSEWTPGIDGDPHIYILYVGDLGLRIAGYFSSVDSLHPLLRDDSNGHEMFVLNADTVELASPFTFGTLAHEFQHMIHWNVDRDETSWLNEGLSELAAKVNRLFGGGAWLSYIEDPDLQLNDWPNTDESRLPNYGVAFLFTNYTLDRLGPAFTKALVAHPENGLKSIDLVMAEAGVSDGLRSDDFRADQLVLDFAITNFVNDPEIADGRFAYEGFSSFSEASPTDSLFACSNNGAERRVRQYGVHYLRIDCDQPVTLRFEGALQTELLPADPFSGNYAFWSNKGDHSDMRLTRAFDFTEVEAPITLEFEQWRDIETNWDFIYLLASEDGGTTWEFVQTPTGTDDDPTGNNYGYGWTDTTPALGWAEESVDLSDYAGKEILLRFEYVTDAAVFGEGMLIDDISVPAIEYFTDFEQDDGGWEAEGWVRTKNILPQTFELALVTLGGDTTVKYLELGADNQLEIPLTSDAADVLVIVPTTRFTRQPATYSVGLGE